MVNASFLTQVLTFTSFIVLSIPTSYAQSYTEIGLCRNVDGNLIPLKKLICESNAALVEASNPNLKIPHCIEELVKPKVLPEHLPVSAVFVTCRTDNEDSCSNIASEILKKNTGATVNILINKDMLTNSLIEKLKKLVDFAKINKAPLNIIPISVPIGVYMRDPGVMAHTKDGPVAIANPHVNGGFLGEPVLSELSNLCGYRFEKSAAKLAKFDAAYEMLVNPRYQASSKSEVPEKIRTIKTDVSHQQTGAELFGGNFMALPGGTLIVGESGQQVPAPEILSHFEKHQKVIKIKLPRLAIGHVDEVYRIIPTQDECGFAILYASPQEMINFLQTRNKNEVVIQSDNLSQEPPYKRNPELTKKFNTLISEITKLNDQKMEIPKSLQQEFQKVNDEFAQLANLNLTAGDLLKDQVRMTKWLANEKLIQKELKKIVTEIKDSSVNKCEPQTIALPMEWNNVNNSPILPNPVNALTVNGTYFHSKPNRSLYGKNVTNTTMPYLSGRREIETETYSAFENYVHERLRPFFGEKIVSVDTSKYDEGNGNFHCATLNILLPCK